MSKHIKKLSLVVAGLIMANASHAAEVYNKDGNKLDINGMVVGENYITNDQSQNGDQSYMRFGFRGETQITDQLTGYGFWQAQWNLNQAENESDSMYTRKGFAGVKYGDYGSFDYGRNSGVMYDALSYTDMQPEFDGMTYNSDTFLFNRGNGMATYRNTNFFGLVDGLKFALQYQGKNDGGGEPGVRDVLRQNGDGYGMSASYDIGAGFSLAGAFMSADRTNEQNSVTSGIMGHGTRAEAYTTALKYDANNIYLAFMYTKAYNASRFGSSSGGAYGYANQSDLFEAYAGYTFDFGLVPFVGYNQTRAKDLGASGDGNTYGSQDLVKFIDIGATYNFNKNMNAYVDYKINLIDSSEFTESAGISTDDVVAVGLVYQF
ncbi:Outer membrane protein C precursor [Pantoea sp. AS-PWVM4]|uniref:Porin OmpC n=1 Tax=Pantoea phytobeneficialis TaxID=2052056 RepID=A0AAP9HA38_9GAMM|nr:MULTISPECIES: porin OmpC [Pantoea]ERK09520.1 Outer membrane protein C precursor [Pantoea sp. AS-PWVM4]MDO6407485.1 porin OmpC [Pantoea phytobeneficialis]QGR09468.1 porin OmpC [Pantoea phytobeneficialis]